MNLKKLKFKNEYLLSSIGILIVVLFLWIIVSFKKTDFADGWILIYRLENEKIFSIIDQIRPFVLLPWKIGQIISPNTYIGVNVILLMIFWGKAFLLYAIIRNLKITTPIAAFLISILFIFYPADHGNMMMRALGRHTSVFFYLLSVFLLIISVKHNKNLWKLFMVISCSITVLISEQTYLLMLISPLIFLFEKDNKNINKNLIFWYLVTIIGVINFILAEKPRQTGLFLSGLTEDKINFFILVIKSNINALKNVLLTGWINSFKQIFYVNTKIIYWSLIITVFVFLFSYLLYKLNDNKNFLKRKNDKSWFILIFSISIIVLSFLPYSITEFRYETSRVYYFASIGGSIITWIFINNILDFLNDKINKFMFLLIWVIIIFVISVNSVQQQNYYHELSLKQQKIIVDIIEQAPVIKPKTTIVLIYDDGGFSQNDYVFRTALRWVYEDKNLRTKLCKISNECQFNINKSIVFEYDKFEGTRLIKELPEEFFNFFDKSKYEPYNNILSYYPFPDRVLKSFEIRPSPDKIKPKDWDVEGESLYDRVVCNISKIGNCSLMFSDDGENNTFSKTKELEKIFDNTLIIEFWAKKDEPINDQNNLIFIELNYIDDTIEKIYFDYDLSTEWELINFVIEPKEEIMGFTINIKPDQKNGNIYIDELKILGIYSEQLLFFDSFEN